jgi:hypothetical protein
MENQALLASSILKRSQKRPRGFGKGFWHPVCLTLQNRGQMTKGLNFFFRILSLLKGQDFPKQLYMNQESIVISQFSLIIWKKKLVAV